MPLHRALKYNINKKNLRMVRVIFLCPHSVIIYSHIYIYMSHFFKHRNVQKSQNKNIQSLNLKKKR